MRAWLVLLGRELRRAGGLGDALLAVGVFGLIALLFPFAVGPEPAQLRAIAGGVTWTAALLAALLPQERLFADDYRDGTLVQLALWPVPLAAVVLARLLAQWAVMALALVPAAAIAAAALNLPVAAIGVAVLGLLLGTPALVAIGGIGAGLTLGARRATTLRVLIVLPLDIPVLIFGSAAVEASLAGGAATSHLLFLAAMSVAALTLAPLAAAAAIRQALP